jgi:hypothetical protein
LVLKIPILYAIDTLLRLTKCCVAALELDAGLVLDIGKSVLIIDHIRGDLLRSCV